MKNDYKPLIVAVFLVFAGLVSKEWLLAGPATNIKVVGASGHSPALIGIAEAQSLEMADSAIVTDAVPSGQLDANQPPGLVSVEPTYADAAVQDPGQPVGQAIDPTQNFQYTVKKGDTLSSIANNFGVSAASILNANANISKKSIKVGIIITIPGTAPTPVAVNQAPALPSFNGDFIMPAQGYDYGILDSNNGVNIINSCGTPVIAAADGVVVPDQNIANPAGGWNDGYGNFILIEEPFGNAIYTRYSHLQQSLVSVGDYVKQGQQIGLIGQTGGANVCELNFQVVGAQNPFAK